MREKIESDFTAFSEIAHYSIAKIILEKFHTNIYLCTQKLYSCTPNKENTQVIYDDVK